MSIPGDSDPFLTGLFEQCKYVFTQSGYREMTIDETLLGKIKGAAKQGIVDPTVSDHMIAVLDEFRGRKISSLSTDDKQVIESVFKRAMMESQRVDSGYGSEVTPSREEFLKRAGFAPGVDVATIQKEQKAFQKDLKQALGVGHIEDMMGISIRVSGGGSTYTLGLQPNSILGHIELEEDLYKSDSSELGFPGLFLVDNWSNQRSQYIALEFPNGEHIIVNTREDAEHLVVSARAFSGEISSENLSGEGQDRLFRAILLFTTQHIGNWIVSPLVLLQRTQLAVMIGHEKFDTYIDVMNCSFQLVRTLGIKRKNQFKVEIKATLLTEMIPIPQGFSREIKQERMAAREVIGMSPPVEGSVTCSFICSITPNGDLNITDIKSKYILTIKD